MELNYIFFMEKNLFEYLKKPEIWDNIILWLKEWKESLPKLPEINFDKTPERSFQEIKDLELRHWRKILENDKLWREGVMEAIFHSGTTLEILLEFFKNQNSIPFKRLSENLEERIKFLKKR